jgi:hypothetical protein
MHIRYEQFEMKRLVEDPDVKAQLERSNGRMAACELAIQKVYIGKIIKIQFLNFKINGNLIFFFTDIGFCFCQLIIFAKLFSYEN